MLVVATINDVFCHVVQHLHSLDQNDESNQKTEEKKPGKIFSQKFIIINPENKNDDNVAR